MASANILVVDDEKEIADLVEIYLTGDGFRVFKAYNAAQGLSVLEKEHVDLAVLDVMMPDMSGIDMCRKIRESRNIPIIFLTAKSGDLDKIMGLSVGADDYMTKPFNPLELSARVKAQLRRFRELSGAPAPAAKEGVLTVRDLVISRPDHKVTVDGEELRLTPIEFDILYLLAASPGRVFSTNEIFEQVWKEEAYEANNTVMVHIRRLRSKLGDDRRADKIITTVWGVGYKIEK
ncbi:MAG: response regulator transcription factor [Lachnospiraceae bacterium]|nr:response regulator transcription factor [Lachnospiraceae bacterium]